MAPVNVFIEPLVRRGCRNCKSTLVRDRASLRDPNVYGFGVYVRAKYHREGDFCFWCLSSFIDALTRMEVPGRAINLEARSGRKLPDWFVGEIQNLLYERSRDGDWPVPNKVCVQNEMIFERVAPCDTPRRRSILD
jgi:hypothetical protein